MSLIQIIICGILLYILYKPEIIADKLSVKTDKLRLGATILFILIFFQNSSFATILFWLLFAGLIYLLYKPDIIPNKIFYNPQTKITQSNTKKRVFILLCAMFIVLPVFFWMTNENYKESEWERERQEEQIRKVAAEKARVEKKEQEKKQKIKILEDSGVSNAFLLSEQEQNVLLDSIENKNCREKWLKKLGEDFGVHNPNLRKGENNYNVNEDCDYAMDLHTKLEMKAWEKQRKSEAVTIWTLVNDYKKLGVLGGNQKYGQSKFDLKNCQILQISDWSNWTGYTVHLAAGTSNSVNCAMDYGKTEGDEILGKLRVGSRINLNAVVYGPQVDVYSYGSVTIRLEDGTIW